jgi:hypothetical protein
MSIYKFLLLASGFASSVLRVAAAEVAAIPEIGVHQPVLIVQKDVRPQNIMVVYTKVDGAGRFLADPDNPNRPLLGFYWLMDRRTYKPVHWAIKSEIRKRFGCQWVPGGDATRFTVNVNDLKEVNTDLKDPKLDIYAVRTDGGRDVEVQMNLGPSDGNARIKLTSISTNGRAFPPAVHSVTLKGEQILNGTPTGKSVERKYGAENTTN